MLNGALLKDKCILFVTNKVFTNTNSLYQKGSGVTFYINLSKMNSYTFIFCLKYNIPNTFQVIHIVKYLMSLDLKGIILITNDNFFYI